MSPASKTKARIMARVAALTLIAAALYAGLTLHERVQFKTALDNLEREELREYLSQAFPADLVPVDKDKAPDTAGIERRISAFNGAHAQPGTDEDPLVFQLVQLGPVEVEPTLTPPLIKVSSEISGRAGDASARIHVAAPGWFDATRGIVVSAFIGAGLLIIGLMPQPAPINAFPVARDMAIVFDRKVSANQTWGAYRLTHLGGGGTLPGLADNAAAVCNDEHIRVATFDAICTTYKATRKHILRALPESRTNERFSSAMDKGFQSGREQLAANAPLVENENGDLARFRAFVRTEVLGFAVLTLNESREVAELANVPASRVTIDPPSTWLIGGYELYYPRELFCSLIDEIGSGMAALTGERYDSVHVFSDSQSGFISLDFRATGGCLTAGDRKRIEQYLEKPFSGGLSRLAALMEGTGRLRILDADSGFDINERKQIAERTPAGLTNRVQFRKVRPAELRSVRQRMTRKLASYG